MLCYLLLLCPVLAIVAHTVAWLVADARKRASDLETLKERQVWEGPWRR